MRIGQGWDLHRLEDNLPLIIGGVKIDYSKGCVAHSDGDVLIHSIIDSILGAACLGDIGSNFPDTDIKYKNIDSRELLKIVVKKISADYQILNIDSTIILQQPKISKYKDLIRKELSKILNIDEHSISVKAKTKEGVDSTGRGESIEAQSVVLLKKAK